jgi:arsenic resistance protein ArsH
MATLTNGDLNNTSAERIRNEIVTDSSYRNVSLAIESSQDETHVRQSYRPFLLQDAKLDQDWVDQLELSTVLKMVDLQVLKSGGERLKVLVLHGSMRKRYDSQHCTRARSLKLIAHRSYSRLLAYEASRILFRLGCDVRMYDPAGLPIKDDEQHTHPKVQELRELSKWSDGHVWVSPEQHGNLVSTMQNSPLLSILS